MTSVSEDQNSCIMGREYLIYLYENKDDVLYYRKAEYYLVKNSENIVTHFCKSCGSDIYFHEDCCDKLIREFEIDFEVIVCKKSNLVFPGCFGVVTRFNNSKNG